MYLVLILLPLLGSIVTGFFGRKVGINGARLLASSFIIFSVLLATINFLEIGLNNNPVFINLFSWLNSESFNVNMSFEFDSLSVSMLIPVLIISSLVHVYSVGYMNNDPHIPRFFSYLSLFTFMMIILVTSKNYLLMFVGWEGVGVCSYLLVNFWFTRIYANQSSISAFLTNRVGDSLLTLGMLFIIWLLSNLDYSIMFSLIPFVNKNIISLIFLCLLIGAMAKSSQVGLHIWLPMAMEGPTPVSALIHAATMVTAGVYLLIRSSPLIEFSNFILLCLFLGAITTLFSSLIGLFQQDIKKVIAYSTMSQLGMMVIAIGLSSYNVALFHLINHAFYKGLLFLGAGAVLHAVYDNQDFRKYGGLILFLPLVYSVILIASLSLMAFPFLTGYFSKDLILESLYSSYYFNGIIGYVLSVIGAMFTTLYSIKVIYMTFIAKPKGNYNNYRNAHENDFYMNIPLIILAIFSIYFGYITKDIFVGLGSSFFSDNSIFIHPDHETYINTEFSLTILLKLMPFFLTLNLILLYLTSYELFSNIMIKVKINNLSYYLFGFFNQRFLIEFFYNKYLVNLTLLFGSQTTRVLDKGSIEAIGPYGLERFFFTISKNFSYLNNGVVTNYALYILIGAILYMASFNNYFNFYYSLSGFMLAISFINFIKQFNNTIVFTNYYYNLESNFFAKFKLLFVRFISSNFFVYGLLFLCIVLYIFSGAFSEDPIKMEDGSDDEYNILSWPNVMDTEDSSVQSNNNLDVQDSEQSGNSEESKKDNPLKETKEDIDRAKKIKYEKESRLFELMSEFNREKVEDMGKKLKDNDLFSDYIERSKSEEEVLDKLNTNRNEEISFMNTQLANKDNLDKQFQSLSSSYVQSSSEDISSSKGKSKRFNDSLSDTEIEVISSKKKK